MTDGGRYGVQGFIGKIAEEGRPFRKELDHETVKADFFIRHTGQKALLHQICGIGRDFQQFSQYAVCMLRIGDNGPAIE